MFKIGEFSQLTRVSVRMLRHYDEIGLLQPQEVNASTGYRMYSADQIQVMNRIHLLKELGFSLSEIKGLMNNIGDSGMLLALLENRKRSVKESIEHEKNKLQRIETLIKRMEREGYALSQEISIKSIPAYRMLSLRDVIAQYNEEGKLWDELNRFVAEQRIKCVPPTYAVYHDPGYKESDVDVELMMHFQGEATESDRIKIRELEAVPEMAVAFHKGPFEEMSEAYRALGIWMSESGYRISGNTRAIYHKGPWSESDPAEYLTEIQIPVSKG
ncbi:transcriptional regulator [Paenibacillus stellifer]|uniref:Transcriptional regulator n=1 Tax=Paenibacillus stellifer TaxID=169760 RepID=A0A089LV33_9BACL|nr:GyrI-like domain-containing protein [Paenibacillus stellifer]AIQ63980.1 transcriptional regulator [Paenibacillus stellifer]